MADGPGSGRRGEPPPATALRDWRPSRALVQRRPHRIGRCVKQRPKAARLPARPVGCQKSGLAADQRQWLVGHDPDVSLQLLYLIFRQVLGLVLLLGRTSAIKDIEL